MTVQRFIIRTVRTVLFPLLAAVLAVACSKDVVAGKSESFSDIGIEFSAHSSPLETKGYISDTEDILGSWDPSTSTFNPGTGIGLFAFYQKAKSNGYPVDFNGDFKRPDFMYNQKIDVSTTDGVSYSCSYSPKKYWPNSDNDQLSFFAYAPYDASASWEDMKIEASLDGMKVRRHYEVRTLLEEQTDYLWSDPSLNLKKAHVGETIDFSFRHICSRIGVSCRIDIDDDDAYVTVDRVVVRALFNVSGDIVYHTDTGISHWENLERPAQPVEYVLFGSDGSHAQRVRTAAAHIGGEDNYLFPFPGVQDVDVTVTLTQHPTGGETKTKQLTKSLTGFALNEGRASDILLDIKSEHLF